MKTFLMVVAGLVIAFMAIVVISNTTPPSESEARMVAEDRIKSLMRDPGSTKFENTKFYGSLSGDGETLSGYVCGSFNAKNGFGAYAGRAQFIVRTVVSDNGRTRATSNVLLSNEDSLVFSERWSELCKN
ncbi:hypothetical protein [Halomonas colorata]|uniref:hypothetical protein n=1 Tax=Halomonas colorata TaxID=2742615 RepID=UPI001866F3DF|nr:hypothetical protein [Halomonas colorata]